MNWQEISETITDTCIDSFSESIQIHYFNKEDNTYEVHDTKAVYDSDYKQIDVNTGAIISSNAPMIELSKRSLLKPITNKDKIFARETLYKVKEIQPDASGALKVLLSRS